MRTPPCVLSAALVLFSFSAVSLTAVIEVNESPYYSTQKSKQYGGASLTNFFAPLAVFFEGWKSAPRESIAEYLWDFGDGSPRMQGFNAAHVYEEPGAYTVTLVVTDEHGAVSTATTTVSVLGRSGTTYYVDSETGSDSNSGLTPASAWRTASKAFEGANRTVERYGAGDQILFRRGQTFSMNQVIDFAHTKRYGFLFGAFGEGARPIIRNTGSYGGNSMFRALGSGLAHFTMVDLDFRMRNEATGDIASFWQSTGELNQVLFLRVSLELFNSGFILSHGKTNNRLSGAFLVGCNLQTGHFVHLFANASRLAILDSRFDLAGNHVAYIAWLDKGVIQGSSFSRAASARTALRVAGDGGFSNPSNNFYIRNNYIRGWVDPVVGPAPHGDGSRYNGVAVHLAPNSSSPQSMEWAVFEDNTVVDAEKLMTIGSYENLIVRRNLFYTASEWEEARILFSSHHGFDRKPLKNISVTDNTIVNANPTKNGGAGKVFEVREYNGPSYQGNAVHQNLTILDNHVVVKNGMNLQVSTTKSAQLAQVTSNRQHFHSPILSNIFEFGGVKYALPAWQGFSGKDGFTTAREATVLPSAPMCTSSAIVDEGPITVSYSGAADKSGSGLKEVRLWYRKGYGSWIRSALTSPGASGAFVFEPVLGSGTYYFWGQAEDNAGNRSLPPVAQPSWGGAVDRTTLSQAGNTSTYHGQGSANGSLPENGTPLLPPADPGLIAHYKLDDPPNDGVLDSSGKGLDGAVVPPAAPTLVAGFLNGAYAFTQGDGVALPPFDIVGEAFTITAWIHPDAFVQPLADGRIISKALATDREAHWWMVSTFSTEEGVRLRFRLKLQPAPLESHELVASSGDVRLGVWQHVAASYQQGVMRLYLNGQQVGQMEVPHAAVAQASNVPVMLGNQPGVLAPGEDKSWRGKLDDVRIYGYALTQPQVNALVEINQEKVPAGDAGAAFPAAAPGAPLHAWPVALALLGLGWTALRRSRVRVSE